MSDLLDFVIDRRGGTDRWHLPADLDHWRNSLGTWHAEQGRRHE